MNKIKKILLAIKLLILKPSLINLITECNQRWQFLLEKKHPNKTQLPIVNIDKLILNSNETLTTFTFLGGGSLPTDIMLLRALCRQKKECSYFEIGTWRGESVINVVDVTKDCYTLNLSKKEIQELGLPKKYADLHGILSKQNEKIIHLTGNSLHFDFEKLNKKFDVIFIDGNHSYEYVKNDTEKVFKHLVKEDSIVIWHDYAFTPEIIRPEVLCGILDGIPHKYKENLYHVSNTICAIYTTKNINSYKVDFPIKPEKIFEISCKIRNI
jgi:predicted O-methyltransferase YrrM